MCGDWGGCMTFTLMASIYPMFCTNALGVDPNLLGMQMQNHGRQFYGGEGIILKGVENTIRNVSHLAGNGMRETDKVIIDMMTSGMC